MIETADSIEAGGLPLAFRTGHAAARAPLAGMGPGAAVVRVEARAMGGHQKEALVSQGEAGFAWRLASDEGPILGGTDLAPAPLSFFSAGLQADLIGRIQALAPQHAVPVEALEATVENHFSFTGSFASGTGQGATQPARVDVRIDSPAGQEQVLRLVQAAIDASPAMASLRMPLANTFALYVNGRRHAVGGVHASAAPDAADPFVAHRRRPEPSADFAPQNELVQRLHASETAPGPLPASGGSASIVVTAHGRAAGSDGMTTATSRLVRPPGSSFSLASDEGADGARAPSGLGLLSAGVSFCYLTQLLRYVQHRKYDVRAIRLVQCSPFALEGHGGPGGARGIAAPVDTHLFLNGAAAPQLMQELLFYSARTCFLHAALGHAFEPRVSVSINGGAHVALPRLP